MMEKVTEDFIDRLVENCLAIDYHLFPGTTVTVVCITLPSGFNLIGKSACMNEEDFDARLGEELAVQDAKAQLWELEGYYRMTL